MAVLFTLSGRFSVRREALDVAIGEEAMDLVIAQESDFADGTPSPRKIDRKGEQGPYEATLKLTISR